MIGSSARKSERYDNLLIEQIELLAEHLRRLDKPFFRLPNYLAMDRFRNLSARRVQQAYLRLQNYNAILRDFLQPSGVRVEVWTALKYLRLSGHESILDWIRNDDVVEIYDLSGMQVFRTLSFFDNCSYPLEFIFTEPLFYKFERDASIEARIIFEVSSCLLGLKKAHRFENTHPHVIREQESPELRTIQIELGLLTPLREMGSRSRLPPYIMVSSRGRIISRGRINAL